MDTIEIKIDFPAPPDETQQAIEHKFVEKATRAGAIHVHVLKKNGHWPYVAEFVDTDKAAQFAKELTKAAGAVLTVDIKPTSNDVEN
jgi:hypothetical protein